jgi:hypothetical protein
VLVYGDLARTVDPRVRIDHLRSLIGGPTTRQEPAEHRDRLIGALISAGELAQGLVDAEFARRGCDDLSEIHKAALDLVIEIARLLDAAGRVSVAEMSLARLRSMPLPPTIDCKTPEGFAFYAVYPQAYAAAARTARLPQAPVVIGLRSIGTTLAAVTAAATGAVLTVSLRPVGQPFEREVRVSDELRRRLAEHDGPFLIVDEGPGLSGSSFGAVIDLLDGLGVGSQRIILMPSHPGDPGEQASPRRLRSWRGARRLVRTLDDLLMRQPIGERFTDLIGEVHAVEDLSGGAWREDHRRVEQPPAAPGLERRKFRLRASSGVYLARFAGLGESGEAKFRRAQLLCRAGYTPEAVALRDGFLLERWVSDARPIDVASTRRQRFLSHLGQYLGFRARCLPGVEEQGADPSALREMTLVNADELGGGDLRRKLAARLGHPHRLPTGGGAVHQDGRLHSWEWRRAPGGKLIKTDAIDHSCAHDLIGCQDIAWDVAGAACEFGLSDSEAGGLARLVSDAAGAPVDMATVEFFSICYAAYQAGYWAMHGDNAERLIDRYLDRLRCAAAGTAVRGDPANRG